MRGRKEVMKMSGKGKGQLGYGERETIERLIMRKESISGIGRAIGRSPSTVEREIKRNGTDSPAGKLAVTTRNICVHQNACAQVDLCGKGCLTPCRKCKDFLCNRLCPEFEAVPCPLLEKPPYCCNGCIELYGYGCTHPYHFYDAKAAHEKATDRKVTSRMGIDCTPEELAATTAIVKKGLAQGQSIRHIFAANEGKMCCSWRTYYDYVEDGLIEDVSNIHLPRKVRYRKRKKGGGQERGIPREALVGRTYDDFEKLTEQQRLSAVEMDCVVGRQGVDKQAILTILFRRTNFQLMLLLEEKTSKNVVAAIDMLESLCGELFPKVFPIFLCDRGSEFSDPERIEHSMNAKPRAKVYFCDPLQSQQKPKCEKNHVEIRKVLPKGESDFDALSKPDMAVLMSHVNSYGREALGWAAPYDLAQLTLPTNLLDGLSIGRIPAEEVTLKPYLLSHAIAGK